MSDHDWNEGGSRSGLSGMKRFAARERQHERRVIEHPDGRREIIETTKESDVKSDWFSANGASEYEIASAVFEKLSASTAKRELPFHSSQLPKQDAVREIEYGRYPSILPYPIGKK